MVLVQHHQFSRLAPHGASGLKSRVEVEITEVLKSRPSRGEWIEIPPSRDLLSQPRRLAPHGASGLKFGHLPGHVLALASRPSRGEWIEIKT